MAIDRKNSGVQEKLQEILEKIGQGLEQLLNPNRPRRAAVPIPLPVDQRPRRLR